ncbi:MAG TPA: N-acetyltransferase, partial [Armatimonadota bacterium]|nr:N-acetyltransferase [Armatimonadota bacterium]
LTAFPESVQHYVGHEIPSDVLVDAFGICLDAEPTAFVVALVDNQIAGYIFSPSKFSNVIATAIWHGHLLRLLWHWISGKYQIGTHPVTVAIRNWLSFVYESRERHFYSDARILSIAVDPNFQGHGIGTGLVRCGLEYLKQQGVPFVRLEVRPDNLSAIHLYEKFGFEKKGMTRDSQGTWLIMLKDMVESASA